MASLWSSSAGIGTVPARIAAPKGRGHPLGLDGLRKQGLVLSLGTLRPSHSMSYHKATGLHRSLLFSIRREGGTTA